MSLHLESFKQNKLLAQLREIIVEKNECIKPFIKNDPIWMDVCILLCVCRNEMSADKTRRLHKRSSKQTRADDHAVAKTNPGPLKHPSTSSTSASVAQPEVQATSRGCLGCPDRIYLLASVIFQNVHPEKPASEMVVNYGNKRRLPLPEVKSEERHTAYELAFNTLKCKCDCTRSEKCFNMFSNSLLSLAQEWT